MKSGIGRSTLVWFVLVAMLGSCSAPSSTSHPGGKRERETDRRPEVNRPHGTPALSALLEVFAGEAGAAWQVYDGIPAVRWRDSAPKEYAGGRFARAGVIELSGYSTKAVPDGTVGAGSSTISANEGSSGLTLDGSVSKVESLSIRKFYAQANYVTALRAQLGSRASVTAVTRQCQPEADQTTSGNAFYRVDLGQGRTVYAEAYVEDGGQAGPGYTVFDFVRLSPKRRMQELHCE